MGFPQIGAVRNADRTVDHAEIVVDFGDGADRGARRARGGLLFDGDGGGKPLDDVDFGALHLVEELAGVGGKGFDVSPLTFGVDGVESERGFARTGKSGNDGERVARDFQVDVLEVVLPRATHNQFRQSHRPMRLPPQERLAPSE